MSQYPYGFLVRPPLWALALFLTLSFTCRAQNLDARLMEAVRTRDTSEVRRLLKQGANANAENKNGRTPLMEAAFAGYTDTALALLENGAAVNAKNREGRTALFWATLSNHLETLQALVARGADINGKDSEGRTPLFWASLSGYTNIIRALLGKGAHVNSKDNYGWTPLMAAVDLGQVDSVKLLLQKGADGQVRGKDGSTALRLAQKYKNDSIVALLRNASREVPAKNPSGSKGSAHAASGKPVSSPTAKPDAAKSAGSSPTAKPDAAKSAGSSPTAKPDAAKSAGSSSATPAAPSAAGTPKSEILNQKLLQAAEAGDTTEVLSLIRDGAGVNARGSTNGSTPLIKAAARGFTDTVRVLAEKGAEVDATDNAGRTALMEAARQDHVDTVRFLVQHAAATDVHAKDGSTALSFAEKLHYTEIASLLKATTASSMPASGSQTPQVNPPFDPIERPSQALESKTRAQALYRMGLSLRIVEDLWPQSGDIAERAAGTILGDLVKVGAPEDAISLAQQASARLSAPSEERNGAYRSLINDLHNRVSSYCLSQPEQFFFTAGGFTYDMNLLGQEVSKSRGAEVKIEETRKNILPIAAHMAARCANISECNVRASKYMSDAANLLRQSPLLPPDGASLQKLCDQISVALGTDEAPASP